MGSMCRSDYMSLCDVYLQHEVAFEVLNNLGERGCVQFLDVNGDVPDNKRYYTIDMCRCLELEKKLKVLATEMSRNGVELIPHPDHSIPAIEPQKLVSVEAKMDRWMSTTTQMSANQKNLLKVYLQLTKMHYVVANIGPILGRAEILRDPVISRIVAQDLGRGIIVVFTGVVARKSSFMVEGILRRISLGNLLYREAEEDKLVLDPETLQNIRIVAFLIIVQGNKLAERVQKVCNAFKADLFPCPQTIEDRKNMLRKLSIRIADVDQVIKKSKFLICKNLRTINRDWWHTMAAVRKARAVYYNLNHLTLDITRNCLIGRFWVPDLDTRYVQEMIDNCTAKADSKMPSFISKIADIGNLVAPTLHRTNKFTKGFQNLINAYGDSTYRELNPGLYTIITFPFLFALMFGDMGHGFILFVFAIFCLSQEKNYKYISPANEIWKIFFEGRYIILLMGLFSMYTGFLYNDIFSKGLFLTKPGWYNPHSADDLSKRVTLTAEYRGTPYMFGIDPIWKIAKNHIVFENSFKMKWSIIIGVIHMMFGLSLSLLNHLNFKHSHAIYLEFIPQIIFLSFLFFYLVIMIFFKWIKYYYKNSEYKLSEQCAPQILILFINMFLMSETKPVAVGCDAYMYNHQKKIQMVLLLCGLVCIPVMLFASPIYVYKKSRSAGPKSRGYGQGLGKTAQADEKGDRSSAAFHRESAILDDSRLNVTTKSRYRSYQISRHFSVSKKTNRPSDAVAWGSLSEETPEFGSKNLLRSTVEMTNGTEHMTSEPMAEPPTFGELMINQAVHTIEFVLSTISHTASYLRLWALSLAHAQLSEMLWSMIFEKLALKDHSVLGVVKVYVVFAIWAVFTMSILVLMEGLSAFLHTLRLHWVEFMSKFYSGGGNPFQPFSFKILLFSDYIDKTTSVCAKAR